MGSGMKGSEKLFVVTSGAGKDDEPKNDEDAKKVSTQIFQSMNGNTELPLWGKVVTPSVGQLLPRASTLPFLVFHNGVGIQFFLDSSGYSNPRNTACCPGWMVKLPLDQRKRIAAELKASKARGKDADADGAAVALGSSGPSPSKAAGKCDKGSKRKATHAFAKHQKICGLIIF